MKLAFVVTSLANKGPVIVIRDIINNLPKNWDVSIFYFDDIVEVNFTGRVNCRRIKSYLTKVDLSEFNIVHSHLLRADLFCLQNKSTIHKHVSTMHADIVSELQLSHGKVIGWFFGFIWSKLLKGADFIVFLTKLQQGKYPFLNRSLVINNGRPLPISNGNTNSVLTDIKNNNPSKIILGACAYVVKRKGFSQVLRLLSTDYGQNLLFVLVGDGPEINNLKEYAVKCGVNERCYFVGNTTDVNQYLPYFDFFVMTSYSEGMPLALLEAVSHKLPVICSNLPVVSEIFNASEVSFYNIDDIESLGEALNNAIANRSELSSRAHNKYLELYTDVVMSENYQSLYLELARNE